MLAALVAFACAGDPFAVPGGFRSGQHGYAIADPNTVASDPSWQKVRVDDSVLAYRRPGPQLISFQLRCHRPVAKASVMARHLLIGLDSPRRLRSAPVAVDGRDGWEQVFEAGLDGEPIRVKTVTTVADGCSYDFVLMAAGPLDAVEPDFDAWWGSFDLDPPPLSLDAR